MAKTAKLKKLSKSPSLHSRAAKRAPSPTPLQRPNAHHHHHPPSILSPIPNTGISKPKPNSKSSKSKSRVSRAQRLRQEKGVQKAEAVVGKMEVKVQKAVGRGKRGRERRKGWEVVNGEGGGMGRKMEAGEEEEEEEEGWEDEEDVDMGGEGEGGGIALLARAVEDGVDGGGGAKGVGGGGEVVWGGGESGEVEAEVEVEIL